MAGTKRDPNTLSNYHVFRTRHIHAAFSIDFSKSVLKGGVRLSLEAVGKEDDDIVLDTSHLDLSNVTVNGSPAEWKVEPRSEPLGSALKIKVGKGVDLGQVLDVSVDVATTKDCTALQWFTPEQTSNKKHPYMFSQCQAIHARSIFPCQDTPDVKATVDFEIRSPLPVIASGLSRGTSNFESGSGSGNGTLLYTFKQDVPIPSYLFALASGDIAMTSIGPRSMVATGPEELVACKWELEKDMEKFVEVAEEILQTNPYAWTTYNVLVLPPSFPYGGMENPVFTYATPSIISGDRENIDVVAHELAHSWSGNLVSCASWEHFWLNEGWTVYLERRIVAAMHGEAHRDFSAIIGWKALSDSIKNFGPTHPFTKMVVDLKDSDPDDAFSSVPYEKGFTFLYHLEGLLGRKEFDRFIPHYFSTFARQSLDSYEFKEALTSFFFASSPAAAKKLAELDWDAWYHSPGLPPKPDFDTSLADACYALASKWKSRSDSGSSAFTPSKSDIASLTGQQLYVFLEALETSPHPLSPQDSQLLGSVYAFSTSRNIEILSRYFRVGLKARDESVYEGTAELLGRIGRMKFVRPLFRGLMEVDGGLARRTFERNEGFYHPICREMVRKDLFGDGK